MIMKNIISTLIFAFIAFTVNAQIITNSGQTIHNNGAVISTTGVGSNISNINGGVINNDGNIIISGGYRALNNSYLHNMNGTDTIFLTNNWDNVDGDYDGSGNGVVVLMGAAQSFNTVSDTVHRLVLVGSGDKTLNGDLTIRGNLAFVNNDLITTASDTLLLLPTCSFVDAAPSAASHINGPVYRIGGAATLDLRYPIGNGTVYRDVTLKGVDGNVNPPMFSFAMINGPVAGATSGFGVDQLVNTRYWFGDYIKGSYQGAELELSYGLGDGITDQSQLVVAQSDASNGKFNSLDQNGVSGVTTNGTVTSKFEVGDQYFMIGKSANIRVNLSAYLEGAYAVGSMHDSLFSGSFGNILETHYGAAGADANDYNIRMLNRYSIPTAGVKPVDVIMLTIRDGSSAAPPNTDMDTTYAWLMSDGSIRDFATGTSSYATFTDLAITSGSNYTVLAHHRNHLPIMFSSGSASSWGLTADQSTVSPQFYDLTDPLNIYGIGFNNISGAAALYIGNGETVNTPLEVNAFDLWTVGNDAANLMPNSDLINTDVTLSGATNQTDWDKTSWANDQLYYSTLP